MSINVKNISSAVFNLVKGYGLLVKAYNDVGEIVFDPEEATRFVISEPNMLIGINEQEEVVKLSIYKKDNNDLTDDLRRQIKEIAKKYLFNFDFGLFGKKLKPVESDKIEIDRNKQEDVESGVIEGIDDLKTLAGLNEGPVWKCPDCKKEFRNRSKWEAHMSDPNAHVSKAKQNKEKDEAAKTKVLDKYWKIFVDTVSNVFPDGDPIDMMASKYRDFDMDLLTQAAQRQGYDHPMDHWEDMARDFGGPSYFGEDQDINEGAILDGIEGFISLFKKKPTPALVNELKDAMAQDSELADIVANGINANGVWRRGYRSKFEDYVTSTMDPAYAQKLGFVRRGSAPNPNYGKKEGGLTGFMDLIFTGKRHIDRKKELVKKKGDPRRAATSMANNLKNPDFRKHVTGESITEGKKNSVEEQDMNDETEEGVMEGLGQMTGSSKTSYQPLDNVKIVVKHKNPVNEESRGARSRNIHSIYIQRGEERFKMQENNLKAARAMARHINQGGEVFDSVGTSIMEMATEQRKLKEFVRYVKSAKLINETNEEYVQLAKENINYIKTTLEKLCGAKTYANAVESIDDYNNVEILEDDLDLESKFTETHFDDKVASISGSIARSISKRDRYQRTVEAAIANESFDGVTNLLQETDGAIEFATPQARLSHQVSRLGDAAQNETLRNQLYSISKTLEAGGQLGQFEYSTVKNCLLKAQEVPTADTAQAQDVVESYAKFLEQFDIL